MAERRQDSLTLLMILPNVVTVIGLCAGLTALRYTLLGRYDLAVMLIVFGAVIDGLDGLLARRLGAASPYGAELDSLSDFLNFGVATGIVVFQFTASDARSTTWVFTLVYIIATCLRLARFNVNRDAPQPAGRPHFVGVPAPGGAMLALLPLFLTFAGVIDATDNPLACGLYLTLVGIAMISKVRTPSPKSLRIPREKARYVLIGAAIVIGLMLSRLWALMSILSLLYGCIILWSVLKHLRHRAAT